MVQLQNQTVELFADYHQFYLFEIEAVWDRKPRRSTTTTMCGGG